MKASSVYRPPCMIPLLEGELWWGGRTADGMQMPFGPCSAFRAEPNRDLLANQGAPLLVSSRGRYIWSEHPFTYEFSSGGISLAGSMAPVLLEAGEPKTLAGAFKAAARVHFPSAKQIPPEVFFAVPQYNTWIELNHRQTQKGVLDYARGIVENGYPPGVLMIDAGWFEYFGHFDFHPGRFRDPHSMVRQLKEWGFRVMLWISPYVSADSPEYRVWRDQRGWLLRNRDGTPAVLEWWDGHSVHLDPTHPEAVEWLHSQLRRLQRDYGIDGFKFDAGDAAHYLHRPASWLDATPVELSEAWARIGLQYPFNEFRACWKLGGQPIVQRLADRSPLWNETGLASLIPNTLAAGLLGHSFMCPDMIGGGDYLYFTKPGFQVDEELFIRSAQASALFPMMQFSSAPWRVLSPKGNALCLAAAKLHEEFAPLFLAEAKAAARTGEPILRSLEYEFPHQGYGTIQDQFFIGHTLMVAPVLRPGARSRKVVIPPGNWQDEQGGSISGPRQIEAIAPMERLPYWRKK
ncbi:MAG: glycoside hydrolase family 31 protein [Chthoniobacteraceae bacterium]